MPGAASLVNRRGKGGCVLLQILSVFLKTISYFYCALKVNFCTVLFVISK